MAGNEKQLPLGLRDLILAEFQSVLRENLNHPRGAKHGHPPKYGYVEFTEFTADEVAYPPAIEAWFISCEVGPGAIHPTQP